MENNEQTEDFPIIIKRLSSSRHLRLRVDHDGSVIVTAPRFAPQRAIDEFIQENSAWISEKRNQVVSNLTSLTDSRSELFFHGKEYQFRLNIALKTGVEISRDKLIVSAPSEDHQAVRAILEKWYSKQAKAHFVERLPLLADVVDSDVRHVSIRGQKTRWGSCSSRDTISLNWRLIMAPDFVSDYVIYHELAHLKQMNHSNKFWQLVEGYCPRYLEAEKWLKDHHNLLHF